MSILKLFKDKKTGESVLLNPTEIKICPFQFVQSLESNTWIIIHNRNSTNIIAQVYIDNEYVEYDNLTYTENIITISFSVPVKGFANIILYTKNIDCKPLPSITPSPTPTLTRTPTLTVTPSTTVTNTNTPTLTPTLTFTPTVTVTRTPSSP